jgi:hypothetical protein
VAAVARARPHRGVKDDEVVAHYARAGAASPKRPARRRSSAATTVHPTSAGRTRPRLTKLEAAAPSPPGDPPSRSRVPHRRAKPPRSYTTSRDLTSDAATERRHIAKVRGAWIIRVFGWVAVVCADAAGIDLLRAREPGDDPVSRGTLFDDPAELRSSAWRCAHSARASFSVMPGLMAAIVARTSARRPSLPGLHVHCALGE